MQTFLPYADFYETAKCLDFRRLNKQRIEAKQLIDIIESNKTSGAWVNHPATKMWRGYVDALKIYYNIILDEWIRRGYKNNMKHFEVKPHSIAVLPKWFGKPEFHAAHRSNLLRKDYKYYSRFGWTEQDDLPYLWE